VKIGFIGLGIMGSRMVANLVKSGLDVTVYNRNSEKTKPLVDIGAKASESIEGLTKASDVVITMVSTPEAVKSIAGGGLIDNLDSSKLWIDSTTVDPDFSVEMSKMAKEKGASFMDAPVAGSLVPAEKGELVFLVGGEEGDLKKCGPLFDVMGKKTVYCGDVGKGSAMKLVVNSMLGAGMVAFNECIAMGKALGFDRDTVFEVLTPLPVTPPLIAMKEARVKEGNYSAEFPLRWMHKDLVLSLNMAKKAGLELPLFSETEKAYKEAMDEGLGEEDISAIWK